MQYVLAVAFLAKISGSLQNCVGTPERTKILLDVIRFSQNLA